MPKFLASYDLAETRPDPHHVFLEKAEEKGWYTWIRSNDFWYKLPNTTIKGIFDNHTQAVASFKAIAPVVRDLGFNAIVRKWIVVEYTDSSFDSDEQVDA